MKSKTIKLLENSIEEYQNIFVSFGEGRASKQELESTIHQEMNDVLTNIKNICSTKNMTQKF